MFLILYYNIFTQKGTYIYVVCYKISKHVSFLILKEVLIICKLLIGLVHIYFDYKFRVHVAWYLFIYLLLTLKAAQMYINSFLLLIMTGTGFVFKLSLKCIFLLKFDDRCSKRCSKIFERNVWFTNLSKHFLIQYFFFQLVQLVYFSSISIVCFRLWSILL